MKCIDPNLYRLGIVASRGNHEDIMELHDYIHDTYMVEATETTTEQMKE